MRLLFCSCPVLGYTQPPVWLQALRNLEILKANKWAVYDPWFDFSRLLQDPILETCLKRDPGKLSQGMFKAFSHVFEPDLFMPYEKVKERLLKSSNTAYSSEIVFQSLYVLLRSDVVVADLNEPDYGKVASEVCYAGLCQIPVIGLLHKYRLEPFVQVKLSSVIAPETTEDIVRQILAFTLLNDILKTQAKENEDVSGTKTEQPGTEVAEGRESVGKDPVDKV